MTHEGEALGTGDSYIWRVIPSVEGVLVSWILRDLWRETPGTRGGYITHYSEKHKTSVEKSRHEVMFCFHFIWIPSLYTQFKLLMKVLCMIFSDCSCTSPESLSGCWWQGPLPGILWPGSCQPSVQSPPHPPDRVSGTRVKRHVNCFSRHFKPDLSLYFPFSLTCSSSLLLRWLHINFLHLVLSFYLEPVLPYCVPHIFVSKN